MFASFDTKSGLSNYMILPSAILAMSAVFEASRIWGNGRISVDWFDNFEVDKKQNTTLIGMLWKITIVAVFLGLLRNTGLGICPAY